MGETQSVSFRMETKLLEELDKYAKKLGKDRTGAIMSCLIQALTKNGIHFQAEPELLAAIDKYAKAWNKDRPYILSFFLRQALSEDLPVHMRTGGILK